MPFASQKQRAFMYARHPEIAKRWRKESGPQKGLPEYSSKSKRHKLISEFQRKHGKPKR